MTIPDPFALEMTTQGAVPASERFHLDVVQTESGLDALRPEWDHLFERSASSVFQSYEWNRAWWSSFGQGLELHCLCIREGADLVGLFPLCRETIRLLGMPLARRLRFSGVPQTDYLDALIIPGYEQAVAEAAVRHLDSIRRDWDVLDLEEIGADSSLVETMSSALIHAHLTPIVARGPVCPVVALPTTFDAYLRSIGGNTRYTYQKKLRELRDRHGLTIDVIDAPSPDLDSGIEAFMRIHDLRWKSLGHPSVYDQQVHRDFLRRVAVSFAARGWLRLFVLRADGMVVSVSVEFNSRHRIYMYQSNAAGPDPLMRLSPGLVIKFAAIERGIAEGMTEYDTLRGEEPYKFDNLKAAPTYNRCLKVQNPDFRGRIGYSYSLVHLLLTKVRGRILLESYEYRRFVTTKRPSGGGRLKYAASRAASVFALGTRFIRTFVLRRHRKTAHTHSGEGVGH